ncbi:DsbA family protein [Microbacterium aoyamense]|uniref:DsbA family protein n=1 Tax=Microbacterium aoyamense TaxID=344166 RepID=A0ABN2Q0X3_9MICO|nr:thioredoxin domain-containing protein [Microbacterium aoyamense]
MNTAYPPRADDHSTGPATAAVTIIEYGDYQCPYCGAAYPVVRHVLRKYQGRIRFIFRNFPIAERHPEALNAASLAEFAADHGRFWATHDALFMNQSELGPDLYERICRDLTMDYQEYRMALLHDVYRSRIERDEREGLLSGVNGTPTFFVNGEIVTTGTAGLVAAVSRSLALSSRLGSRRPATKLS